MNKRYIIKHRTHAEDLYWGRAPEDEDDAYYPYSLLIKDTSLKDHTIGLQIIREEDIEPEEDGFGLRLDEHDMLVEFDVEKMRITPNQLKIAINQFQSVYHNYYLQYKSGHGFWSSTQNKWIKPESSFDFELLRKYPKDQLKSLGKVPGISYPSISEWVNSEPEFYSLDEVSHESLLSDKPIQTDAGTW